MKQLLLMILLLTSCFLSPKESYQLWKEKTQNYFASMHVQDTLELVVQLLAQIRELKTSQSDNTELTYLYSFILELIEPSYAPAPQSIDWQWLHDLEEEILTLWLLEDESLRADNVDRATDTQRDLLLNIKQELHITQPLALLSLDGPDSLQTSHYIALSRQGNLNSWLATAYHEMYHVVCQDSLKRNQVRWGELSAEDLLLEPSLQQALQLSEQYINSGKKVFDQTTRIGRHINNIVTRYTTFYKTPQNPQRYRYYMLIRGQEQRADLFEFEKLLEHKLMDALWQELDSYAMSGESYISTNPWPSDIERALCIAGFLEERDVDVNKGLREWEKKQSCPVTSKAKILFQALTPGAQDAQRAYRRWRR